MRARGEQLAKDGRYSEAIDAFKAAERIEPRARHACLIALAYIRRELWPQAEIFLDQCETRATPADPLPEWVPMAKQQLAERLAAVNVAPVELKVEPAGVDVKLAVSSFAPDELFTPRTIHLPPGRHVIIATAAGYNDAQKTVDVSDKTPQTVTITMLPEGTKPPGPEPERIVTVVERKSPSPIPNYVMIGGGVVVLAGVFVHAVPYRNAREDLADAPTPAAYALRSKTWTKWRNTTIGLYAAGAAVVGTGLVLKYTLFKNRESAPQVAVEPRDGGGMVTVGWTR